MQRGRKMTKEELIKNQFPNDEFLQAAVSLIVDKCVAELEKENTTLWTMVKEKDKQIGEFEKLPRKVKELEAEVKEWKDKAELWCKTANLKDHNIMINKELQKENAELKCECRRCVYSDCPCILSDYGKDRNGICDHFKDVFDEIVELKDNFKIAKDNEYEYSSLLTNAKELLRRCYDKYGVWDVPLLKELEQFLGVRDWQTILKDSEVEK